MSNEVKKIGAVRIDNLDLPAILAGKAEGSNYIGAGDNMLHFGKATSFLQENKTGFSFQLKITNTGEDTKQISLCDGLVCNDGVKLKDGTTNGINIVGSPRKSELFRAFIKTSPIRISEIRMKVDDEDQLDEPFVYTEENPFAGDLTEQVIPANYQSSKDPNSKLITIDDVQNWILSRRTQLTYNIRAGRTVTITLSLGACMDLTTALNKKAKEATYNVAAAYARSTKK